MIVESIISCSCLLLICGSCIYILKNDSYQKYNKFLLHFSWALIGATAISARSLIAIIYKIFFKSYTLDPALIEIEEQRNKSKINPLDQFLGIAGIASLMYSVYCHHGYCIFGLCIITSLSMFNAFKIHRQLSIQSEPEEALQISSEIFTRCGSSILLWIFINGWFAHTMGNYYAVVSNYPLLVTTWALPTESFYQGWTIRRAINDYMMSAYIILMIEALRQKRTV